MVIKPKLLKVAAPLLLVYALWFLALLMPPASPPGSLLNAIILPAIFFGIFAALVMSTKFEIDSNGLVRYVVGGYVLHQCDLGSVVEVRDDYMFRGGPKGVGAGKGLYIKYRNAKKNNSEILLGYNIFSREDLKEATKYLLEHMGK